MRMPDWSLVQYRGGDPEQLRTGVLVDDKVVQGPPELEGLDLLQVVQRWEALAPRLRTWTPQDSPVVPDAVLTAPLTYPSKVLCAGANYFDHIAEMGVQRPAQTGDPFFFLKPPTTTVTGPGAAVPLPGYPGARVDWEAELAVVIGKSGRDVPVAEADGHIAGYVVANDISARDRLRMATPIAEPFTYDWLAHKGQDGFCPMGPGIVPAWQVTDPQDLRIRLSVNGTVKQDSDTGQMMVPVRELVAAASRLTRLEPGDVILTGTPAGCGVPRGEFLNAGDEIVVEIEGVGRLHNTVVQA
ncbi:fumarylacetoacetate hydrolase family protein [Streptomyces cellulosae]|uniref:fumarylacetoacetate hydrolase family protein n=1 Tax=Streptomyces cellulosae TaxID=1968 RepID=UPI0004C93141|nr:fumarylacetoacetate hydrolase family protein [Streptomyces cellulosae]